MPHALTASTRLCACAQILDQGNSAFSSQQFSTAIPFFNFVKNVTQRCTLAPRPVAVFASQFGPDSNGLTELATINGSTAYYVSQNILNENLANEAASNDTSDPLGADEGEAALDFYGSPYANLPNCASLNAQVERPLPRAARLLAMDLCLCNQDFRDGLVK